MANLGNKDGVFVVRFRYQGKEYKRSLKTRSEDAAKAALHVVELTVHRLHTGQLQNRDGVDPGDFIVSGGTWSPPPVPRAPLLFPTTAKLIERYLAAKEHEIAESYRSAQQTHLKHLKEFLGKVADQPCNQVTRTVLENFLRDRKKVRDGQTVNRQRVTLNLFYRWVVLQEDVPPFPFPAEKLPRFKGSRDRDPFKTVTEIEAVVARGGLEAKQELNAWEALYLDPTEIAGLLALVRSRADDFMSFLLHAIPAYSGMRRGELLRLQWGDVDLVHDYIIARSRKQSRTRQEVSRRIDLHPELKQHLIDWQRQRPHGQLLLSLAPFWQSLGVGRANGLFWQPLRGTKWCLDSKKNWFKLGFHTYRHSFASNLAAAGVDHRIIDEFMGHTTREMQARYRHLFPKNRRSAIECFSLADPKTTEAEVTPLPT